MDSWVILDSMKVGEGQKGCQRELTHQSKNPVVKTEQRVSSIALTIHGAKVSHYKMLFSPFLFCPAKLQEEMFVCVGSSQAGDASCTQVPIAVQTVIEEEDSHFHLGSTQDPLRAGVGF